MSVIFETGLEKLQMLHEESGLRFVSEIYKDDSNLIENFTEWIELERASKLDVTAVYFRRFENRPPKPQVYIFDNTEKEFDEFYYGEIHKKIWSSGVVPLAFVFTNRDVKIFNCTKHANTSENGLLPSYLEESLSLVAKVNNQLAKYNAYQFDSGLFWEEEYNSEAFKYSNSAYDRLINGLREVRKEFIKRSDLNKSIAHRLLVQSILIKYLEERKDDDGKKVFPNEYFKKYDGAENFCDILRKKGACLELFDDLSNHFNGKIFEWGESRERKILENKDLHYLADFLDATKETTGQLVLWRLYSFNHLPIELISSIYEEFLGDRSTGAVYTPPHLVSYLIDESMTLSQPSEKEIFKILDPACGSGIFLVAAFKRLVEWWRIKRYEKGKGLERPDLYTLKKIISNNLYGVDINSDAVQLTVFSLSLALCDMLTPTEIWYELKFEELIDENIFCKDFFEYSKNGRKKKFDLVIGNPPFIEKFSSKAAKKKASKRDLPIKIPQNQIALLFLEESYKLLSKKGDLCLIMPSAPLLYNIRAFEYRKCLFSNYPVTKVIDFTPLHSVLWSGVSVSTAAIFIKKGEIEIQDILHLTVRRTKQAKEKLYFEIDEYDFHYVGMEEILNNQFIWKINLLGGGGRLNFFIKKLSKLKSLQDYLKVKESSGWVIGEGYTIGDTETKSQKEIKENYQKADYITSKPTLPTDALTEKGIDRNKIKIETEEYFIRPRKKNKRIYQPPHILIKEKLGKNHFPIAYSNEYLTFKHRIFGIHAPPGDEADLKKVFNALKSFGRLYKFFISCISSESGVKKSTAIYKNDVLKIPFSENFEELELSTNEELIIDDILEYMLEFIQKGENARILKKPSFKEIKLYCEVLCEVLNSVYRTNEVEFNFTQAINTGQYVVTFFKYGVKRNPENIPNNSKSLNSILNEIIPMKYYKTLLLQRSLRLYSKNSLIIIKPNQKRYWLQSIALKDADKVFAEFVDSGY